METKMEELSLRLQEQVAMYKVCLTRMLIESKSVKLTGTNTILTEYLKVNPLFDKSVDCKFIKNLIEAFESGNQEKFHEVMINRDLFMKLETEQAKILYRIKDNIKIYKLIFI
jgi:hypothetical protein